jgi:hypothetical protein
LRVSLRAIFAVAAAGIPVSLASVVAGPAAAAAHQAGAARPAVTSFSTAGGLAGVAAASRSNAWAVGFTGNGLTDKVLMLHWNGRGWSRLTSPKVLTGSGQLTAVTVVSARDAWAVGSTGGGIHPHTLILHWNGRAWNAVTSPAPVANGSLTAVTANARGGWAVGSHSTGPTVPQTSPVIFRLTGTKWARVDPKFGANSGVVLDGVATTSAGTTFASGLYTGMITGVLARWSGKSWSWDRSFPEQGTYHWLNAIAAGPRGTAFALGPNTASAKGGVISIRWTGHAWVRAPAPAPASADPDTVALAPGGTEWAAGSTFSGSSTHPLILRWNGHAWARVASPARVAELNGLGFATARYGWAVGRTTPASGKTRTLILHWNGRSWG